MKTEIEQAIAGACKDLFAVDVPVALTRPDEQFGDYATNVALQLAQELNKNPRDIADQIAKNLQSQGGKVVKSVQVAGQGFINITLNDEALWKLASHDIAKTLSGQEILVEFGDPNPFKEMHIGHLYSYIVGDAISSLLEAAGAKVERLSYHGDVGLHVAKAIWGMQQSGVEPDKVIQNVGLYYQKGAAAYEGDAAAKANIDKINEHIYKKDDDAINQLYDWGKQESFREFDAVIGDLGITTDKRYLESESAQTGMDFVKKHQGKVFKDSDGAVVYEGEKVGLHTRVFITGKELPTYETKDLGLAELKNSDFPKASRSIIITAHEQSEYFKVMLAALKEIDEELAKKTAHLAHGFLSLSTGKMSSRKGDVFTATRLMVDVEGELEKKYPDSPQGTDLAAIKYGFLKHRLGSDIVYDVEESVSLQGNSGPYLQYAHARARSILRKPKKRLALSPQPSALDEAERNLLRKIGEYAEVVDKAVDELMSHHTCTYLYELAQVFNRFYEKNRVIGDEREAVRTKLVQAYADTLKNGLELLNISAPEKM